MKAWVVLRTASYATAGNRTGRTTVDRVGRGGGRGRILLLAATLCALVTTPAVAQRRGPLAGLDGYVQRVLKDWQVPGLALAVVKDDSVVLARGYGVRELGKPDPVDANTLFAIASTSKAFTVAALGMLVDEGRLHWDDPVTKYLPGFQLYDPYVTRELTVRDLLSHRSGLARGDQLWYLSPFSRAEVLRRVRFLKPQWSFRSHYGYQNIMFITAGQIIPAVTDTSWDDFVRARIFQPLGMARTTTTTSVLAGMTDVATPHVTLDGKVTAIPWPDFDNLGGAGAINSSVAEMARWLRLQLGHGVYAGKRLLSDSVVAQMRMPNTVIPLDSTARRLNPDTHLETYGMGWFLQDYHDRLLVRHSGSLDGMRTHVAMIPQEHLGVVVIANLNESDVPQAVAFHLLDRYLGVPDRDWSALLLADREKQRQRTAEREKKREAERVPDTHPSLPLPRYAGIYRSQLYGDVVVEEGPAGLVVHFGPHFVGDLEHWNYDTFRAAWRDRSQGKAFLTFRLDIAGAVASVEVEGMGSFQRVKQDASPGS